jgi:hypothetical protein
MANRMNEKQADTKAKQLWGPYAYVLDRKNANFGGAEVKRIGRFYVGCPTLGDNFPYGNGNTWEAAFENVSKH